MGRDYQGLYRSDVHAPAAACRHSREGLERPAGVVFMGRPPRAPGGTRPTLEPRRPDLLQVLHCRLGTGALELQAACWQKQFTELKTQAEQVRGLSTKPRAALAFQGELSSRY